MGLSGVDMEMGLTWVGLTIGFDLDKPLLRVKLTSTYF